MEGEGSHIIRKATLNFNLNGNYDGLQLQQEISGWAGEILIPALDSALAAYAAMEEVMVIDSLSIDIEVDFKADWKQGLEEKISGKLAEMVRRKAGKREKKRLCSGRANKVSSVFCIIILSREGCRGRGFQ